MERCSSDHDGERIAAVAELKWASGRNAGRFRFVEAEIVLRIRELERAEVTTRRIKEQIREAVPYVDRVLIHAEPMERTHLRYAVPLEEEAGSLSEHFGEAPYFALVTVRLADGAIEEQQIVANPHTMVRRPRASGWPSGWWRRRWTWCC